MKNLQEPHLHPMERVNALDSNLRRLLQNPRRILKKYIRPKMKVLDLGCGTGYFTLEIARLVGSDGKVVALDVQAGMLEILKQKIIGTEFKNQIQISRNQEISLGLAEEFDFILAFYSLHEIRFIDEIIHEMTKIVKPETKILISEQKFHVSKKSFDTIIYKMKNNGFMVVEKPNIFLSRTVVMRTEQNL